MTNISLLFFSPITLFSLKNTHSDYIECTTFPFLFSPSPRYNSADIIFCGGCSLWAKVKKERNPDPDRTAGRVLRRVRLRGVSVRQAVSCLIRVSSSCVWLFCRLSVWPPCGCRGPSRRIRGLSSLSLSYCSTAISSWPLQVWSRVRASRFTGEITSSLFYRLFIYEFFNVHNQTADLLHFRTVRRFRLYSVFMQQNPSIRAFIRIWVPGCFYFTFLSISLDLESTQGFILITESILQRRTEKC